MWATRLTDPGWLLLPLRAFLGFTFCFAGLQKLANPAYLDPHSPTSVVGQMRLLQHRSPIGGLLGVSLHAPTLVGLLIALGELAVGVGTVLGLFARLAAIGGAVLSLTFFLTVSWSTTPYYYGSDIVFVFAWLTLFAFGTGDVLSVQTWVRQRARNSLKLRPSAMRSPRAAIEINRRQVVWTAGLAAAVGVGTALTAGLTAAIGRALHRSSTAGALKPAGPTTPTASASASSSTSAPPTSAGSSASGGGTVIGPVTAVPAGQARSFTDPASGNPAWVVHLNTPQAGAEFVAFSAVCTHAGCPVQYDQSNVQFVCPCHGGVYDARTGQVLQGPPPAPLQPIPLKTSGDQLQVDA